MGVPSREQEALFALAFKEAFIEDARRRSAAIDYWRPGVSEYSKEHRADADAKYEAIRAANRGTCATCNIRLFVGRRVKGTDLCGRCYADWLINTKEMVKADAQAAFFAYGTGMRWPTRPAHLPKETPQPTDADDAGVPGVDLGVEHTPAGFCEHGRQATDGHEACLRIPPIRPCYVCDADTGVTREGVPMCIKCRS